MKKELKEIGLMLEGLDADLRKLGGWICRLFTK